MVTPHAVFGALALFHLSWAGDPVNVAAFHGNNVTINCTVEGEDDSKSWEKDGTTIVSGDGQPDDRTKYSITKNNGSYNLGINNVQTTDAGEYMCGDKLAYLIVAENLQCNVMSAGSGKVKVTCNFQYGGTWVPTCEFKKNGDNIEPLKSGGPKTANNQYTREVGGVAVIADDKISCSLFMTPTERPGNAPEGDPMLTPPSSATKTQTLTSPDRTRLDPDGKTHFKEGDRLGCRSTGNPIPTFNWTLNSTGKVFANTSRIQMTSAMSGQVLRCEAYNSVGRQAVTLNVTSVTAAPMNPDKDFAPACTGHPVLLAVVCLVIPMLSRP